MTEPRLRSTLMAGLVQRAAPASATDAKAVDQLVRVSRLAMVGELVACFAYEVSNPLMLTLVSG